MKVLGIISPMMAMRDLVCDYRNTMTIRRCSSWPAPEESNPEYSPHEHEHPT